MEVVVSGTVRVPRMLVVEDDLLQMMGLFGLRTSGKAEIVWADDLTRGLNAYDLHQWDFDAIVLDGNLGRGETSVPLARYINDTGFKGRRIRISGSPTIAAELDAAGFKLSCPKPFLPRQLLKLAM